MSVGRISILRKAILTAMSERQGRRLHTGRIGRYRDPAIFCWTAAMAVPVWRGSC